MFEGDDALSGAGLRVPLVEDRRLRVERVAVEEGGWEGDFGESEVAHDRALGQLRHGQAEDRKSTRLNSSHVSISYAVFCLIKKNFHFHLDLIFFFHLLKIT